MNCPQCGKQKSKKQVKRCKRDDWEKWATSKCTTKTGKKQTKKPKKTMKKCKPDDWEKWATGQCTFRTKNHEKEGK
jgi:hypothetical protein